MSYYNGYSINPITNTTTFYGESSSDLALMPTTTKEGEGKYKYGFATEGSYAEILSSDGLKIYMLRSTGWIDVTDVVGGGGGGGSTTDYNSLSNLPQINGTTLIGNKTSDDIDVTAEPRREGENLIFD